MALLEGPSGPEGSYPERHLVREREEAIRRNMRHTGLAVAGLATTGALLWSLSSSNRK